MGSRRARRVRRWRVADAHWTEDFNGGRDQGFSLNGRVAVVTGALGLLGAEFATALLHAGAEVILADVDGDRCRQKAEELAWRTGRAAHGFGVNITDPTSLEALRDAVRARSGRLDVLINSAAINDKYQADGAPTRLETYPLEDWRRALEVNLTGTFLAVQILGGEMARAGRGSIINIASTYGMVGPDQRIYKAADGTQTFWKSPVYSAAKGGVLAFTRYVATAWAERGVRCNALSPGGVEAGQEPHFMTQYATRTPLGRMARADEMRGAVVFLASDASSYMTGANLVVDGGWTAW